MNTQENAYFLPYQIEWLKDTSPVKIWEKSRRIGATYVQSYEDVEDCVSNRVPVVWFSSADISAAKEYILYCAKWAKLFDIGARDLGEIVIDSENDIKSFTIEFTNGTRINALSSNPKAFRSKGGKVILDEFAHHDDAVAMWKAAKPTVTWGFPLRILSTHNGKSARFYKFIESIKKGKLRWSLHTVDINKAVDDGLVDRIYKRKTTATERKEWLSQQEEDCFDRETWEQEYLCHAIDGATAFLTYEEIQKCEADTLWNDDEFSEYFNLELKGSLFLGVDIARKKHLTVMWVAEEIGRTLYTRHIKIMENTPFKIQKAYLYHLLGNPKLYRACIDSTGLGMQLAEEAVEKYGDNRVEGVTFTGRVKEDLAFSLRTKIEDIGILFPDDNDIREDFHSIRKITTASNNIRFDADADKVLGHADRFWAAALMCHAAKSDAGPVNVSSRCRRQAKKITENYDD
jgi:phage FluMu gp28-like protein